MYERGITKSRLTLIFIIFHDSHKPNWLPFILSKFIPIHTTFTFGFSWSTDSIRPITTAYRSGFWADGLVPVDPFLDFAQSLQMSQYNQCKSSIVDHVDQVRFSR